MIMQACREYNIFDKIFSISMDNASNNDASIFMLKNNMNHILEGLLFHNRCACHILNLCVKEGFKNVELDDTVNIIRQVVMFIKTSPSRAQYFKALCKEQGLPFKKFRPDCKTRWNSTFEMLESVIPYEKQLIEFCTHNGYPYQLSEIHFQNCIALSSFLGTFKEAIELLSGSYYPTTQHVLPTLVNIANIFSEFINHPTYGGFMQSMFQKYKKYYENIPILYCMALCLYPRMKTNGFHTIIEYIYETLNFDETEMSTSLRIRNIEEKTAKALSDMYNLYELESTCSRNLTTGEGSASSQPASQFPPPRRSTSTISSSSSSSKTTKNAWGLLKRQKKSVTQYN
jgi:hypothetical protein